MVNASAETIFLEAQVQIKTHCSGFEKFGSAREEI